MRSLISSGSVPVLERPDERAPLVTEVVLGERLEAVGEHGEWLEVVVPDHATRLDPRGYPGWALKDVLLEADDWSPDLTVVAPNGAGLPLGARLTAGAQSALLPDGRTVAMEEGTVLPSGEPGRGSAVGLSNSMLGLPYRWGGTDSTVGMDCSGMVFRVMQLLGITVPRDADDQYEAAPFKTRESWEKAQAGDLVFFGEESVTHVGFYLGEGSYISEHGVGGTLVRGMDEDPYWGFARYIP